MNRTFTTDEDSQLSADYIAGISVATLAARKHVALNTIRAALARAGTPATYSKEARRAHILELVAEQRALSDEQEAALAAEYLAGASAGMLAAKYDLPKMQVFRALHRQRVKRRICTRRLALNEAAFNDAEHNEAAAYFVGVLMADGCITCRRGRPAAFKLSLTDEDSEHIHDLKAFLKSGHKVLTEANGGNTLRSLNIDSVRLVTALARYGVVPRKSLTARVLLLENNRHFWRGIVCGDGSVFIRNEHPAICLAGSEANVKLFLSFCKAITPTRAEANPLKSIWETRLFGSHALAVIRVLFDGCTVALARKWAIAKQVIAEYKPRKHGGRR